MVIHCYRRSKSVKFTYQMCHLFMTLISVLILFLFVIYWIYYKKMSFIDLIVKVLHYRVVIFYWKFNCVFIYRKDHRNQLHLQEMSKKVNKRKRNQFQQQSKYIFLNKHKIYCSFFRKWVVLYKIRNLGCETVKLIIFLPTLKAVILVIILYM